MRVYLAEAVTGFARRMQRWLTDVVLKDLLDDADDRFSDGVCHEDLCVLSFQEESLNLVTTNKMFEHVYSLDWALSEISRVLRPCGCMLGTPPFAYGQHKGIQKTIWHPNDGRVELLT